TMASPYNTAPPGNEWTARQMMARSIPMNMLQMNSVGGMPNGVLTPAGVPLPPGIPGGGLGGMSPLGPVPGASKANLPSDIMQAQFAMNPATAGVPQGGQRTQVRFNNPIGMQVSWYAQGPDGKPIYSPTPIDTPGKYNFLQAARYRLKLTNIPG